jgi:hypothetical protein
VNVGDHLDDAAAALARAQALVRAPPAGGAEQATVAVARTRLYRQLQRQVALLIGDGDTAVVAGQAAAGPPEASPANAMSAWLRQATERTTAAMPTRLPDVPVTGPVGTAVHQAAQAVAAANDLIADNLGDRVRPRTVEAVAMAAGYGQTDNLAATATLALAADAMDIRITRDGWLRPRPGAGAWLPLLLVVGEDVQRNADEGMSVTALRVLGRGAADRAPGRGLRVVPVIDDPSRWTVVTSARQAVTAMDAARTWLLHNSARLSAAQIAATARGAVTIVVRVGQVLAATGPPDGVSELSRAAAKQWREAALTAAALRSTVPAGTDIGTASTAVNAVARWLTEQLRGEYPHPATEWADDARIATRWRRTAAEISSRLADLAELLQDGARQIHQHGNLLRAGTLHRPAGRLIHVPQWVPVEPGDPTYQRLLGSLTRAAQRSQPLAAAAGVQRTAGRSAAAWTATFTAVEGAGPGQHQPGPDTTARTAPNARGPGGTASPSVADSQTVTAAAHALALRIQALVDTVAAGRGTSGGRGSRSAAPDTSDLHLEASHSGTEITREID